MVHKKNNVFRVRGVREQRGGVVVLGRRGVKTRGCVRTGTAGTRVDNNWLKCSHTVLRSTCVRHTHETATHYF